MDYRDTVHDRFGFIISIEWLYGREVHLRSLFLIKATIKEKIREIPLFPKFFREVKIINHSMYILVV